jgi:hypothetical protein
MKEELIVKGMVELVGRVAWQLLAMAAAEMKRYREAQQRGYTGGFESSNLTANNSPGSVGSLVDVSAAGNAIARTIWPVLNPILEDISKAMKPFLEQTIPGAFSRSFPWWSLVLLQDSIPSGLEISVVVSFQKSIWERVRVADEEDGIKDDNEDE